MPILESGLPGFDALAWVALVAPARARKPILKKLRAELGSVATTPEFKEYLVKNASTVMEISTAEETTAFFASEISRWGAILKETGLAATQ